MHRTLGIAHMDVHMYSWKIFAIISFVTDLDRTTSLQERSGGCVLQELYVRS